MRNGFKFNDRHSNEFGVTVKTTSRPIRPAAKSYTLDLPYRDGEYDFSKSNPQSREHFSNRIFTVSIAVTADTVEEMQDKIGELSLWLTGSGELIFDDIPLIVWRGKISDEIIYMPERGGKSAVLDVSFRVNPFGYCIFGTDGPTLDMPISLDDEIPLSLDEEYTYNVQSSAELDFINFGDRPVRPVIEIYGDAQSITLSLGDKSLSFTAMGTVTVDFERQMITDFTGAVKAEGEFFEFPAGTSKLKITNSGSGMIIVMANFTPEYMYTVDFTQSKWG